MIPAIYKLRYRGQFVNDACQYIVEHWKLAVNICIIPMLIFVFFEILNLFLIKSILLTVIIVLLALLLAHVLPSMFMYVTDNPDEFDYPHHTPKILEVRHLFLPYIGKAILIIIIGGIVSIIGSFVIIGSIVVPFITLLALVKYQRKNEYVSFTDNQVYTDDSLSVGEIFSMIFDNFGNFMLLILGSSIITMSMMLGPSLVIFLIYEFIDSFVSPEFHKFIDTCLGNNGTLYFYWMLVIIGSVFANMITLVITHFYYGHCQTKLAV